MKKKEKRKWNGREELGQYIPVWVVRASLHFFLLGVHPRLHFGGANASFLVGSWAENPLFGGMYVLPAMTAKISHGQNDSGAFLS